MKDTENTLFALINMLRQMLLGAVTNDTISFFMLLLFFLKHQNASIMEPSRFFGQSRYFTLLDVTGASSTVCAGGVIRGFCCKSGIFYFRRTD